MRMRPVQPPGSALPAHAWNGLVDLLVASGDVQRGDLTQLAQDAVQRGHSVVDLLSTAGIVPERTLYEQLAAATSMPFVDAGETIPSPLALRMVPAKVARKHLIVPVAVDDRTLSYVTASPFDDDADRDVAFTSGRRPVPWLCCRSELDALLDRSYPASGDLEALVNRIRSSSAVEPIGDIHAGAATDSGVIELCYHLLARAVEAGASDIHIERTHEGAVVRFRAAGILEPVLTAPAAVAQSVCNRFKVMARTDIAVRLRPQDGAFAVRLDGRRIDVRLSSVPTVTGEKVVMRVIDSRSELQTLDKLGYPDEVVTQLRQALSRPDGLVLATGPTGSGKTSALYAALDFLQSRRVNIVSVEDPVERRLDGVTQIPVNAKAGSTFASVLRSVLRQDPNVIMVGEIRDAEVAEILGQAAYTGHLVLSSLHTTDAVTAITRLLNLGLEPFKIAESLSAILAQRLVRRLCASCRVVHTEFDARRHGQAAGVRSVGAAAGPGCPACRFTGFDGRVPIVEILLPDAALREAIGQGASAAELRARLRQMGQPTLRERSLALVEAGVTSLEEVSRVLAEEVAPPARAAGDRRVLIAEDDSITRMLVKLLLEREGYTVLEAPNGRVAVEIAVREQPALIVMDLNMPEMDGYEAIAHLRRVPTLAAVPVIVLTSEDGPGVETRVLQMGADDYLLKPFDPGVLSSRVQAVFRRLRLAVA